MITSFNKKYLKMFNECFDKDNEYYAKYINLVNTHLSKQNSMSDTQYYKYSERCDVHHIVPRAYFKNVDIIDKEIINDNKNLVTLPYDKHMLAHWYMYQCSNKVIHRSMTLALMLMLKKAIKVGGLTDTVINQLIKSFARNR